MYWAMWEQRRGTLLKNHFPGIALMGWLQRGLNAKARNDADTAKACRGRIVQGLWSTRNSGAEIIQQAMALSRNLQRL
jgi:hypothetical protein